jgi:hypothetical protein
MIVYAFRFIFYSIPSYLFDLSTHLLFLLVDCTIDHLQLFVALVYLTASSTAFQRVVDVFAFIDLRLC